MRKFVSIILYVTFLTINLTACSSSDITETRVPQLGESKIFSGQSITVKSSYFRQYLASDTALNVTMDYLPQEYGQWTIIKEDSSTGTVKFQDTVYLRSITANTYFGGNEHNGVKMAPKVGDREKWQIINPNDTSSNSEVKRTDEVAFRSIYFKTYASCQNKLTVALKKDLGAWEKWALGSGISIDSKNWMSAIADSTVITRLTIPGTHDSGTYAWPAEGMFIKTQTKNISEQLEAGIRFLDIRVKLELFLNIPYLQVVHGDYSMPLLTFTPVVEACIKFLQDNPTETILMSVKMDAGSSSVYEKLSKQTYYIYDTFLTYYDDTYWYGGKTIPTLGDVRGKIVFFARTGFTGGKEGIELDMNQNAEEKRTLINEEADQWLEYEDYYSPHSDEGKKDVIKWHLKKAVTDLTNPLQVNTLWVTFTSANKPKSLKGPEYYAREGGVWPLKWLNINGWLVDYLPPDDWSMGPMGIVAMDFPSDRLIESLISSNDFVQWPRKLPLK